MTAKELKAIVNLLMRNDPWPCEEHEKDTVVAMVNKAAIAFGYYDWIDAYHLLHYKESIA